MNNGAALLIVDVQNDFCPHGALAIAGGDRVVGPLNRIAEHFAAADLPVLATRDWHPPATRHFKEFGGVWPSHCIQESPGAAFHPALRLPQGTVVVSKGSDPDSDAYSAFDGRSADGKSLTDILARLHVRRLYIGGLATDYCVRSSVLDARKAGLEVTVLTDAIVGVNMVEGDCERAVAEMERVGAVFRTTDEVVAGAANSPG